MILTDTSVWVDHLRAGDPQLTVELNRGAILMHPFVSAELALGSLGPRRGKILREIDSLPMAKVAHNAEVRLLIEQRSLFGRGFGYVDAHLIAAILLTPDTRLWTRDKRLRALAETLGMHVHLS